MILKEADDRKQEITALETLSRGASDESLRKRIDLELARLRSGIKGEREAAYHLNFLFGNCENHIVIHDLRIEIEGKVAQIDHLVFDRFLRGFVIESKRFSEGISVNERGECSAYFKGKPYGIPSPFEQNSRHMAVLRKLWDKNIIELPTRLAIPIIPTLQGAILVSTNSRIERSENTTSLGSEIVKADQFATHYNRNFEQTSSAITLARVVSAERMEQFGRDVISHHKPIAFDWRAKFGVSAGRAEPPVNESNNAEKSAGKLICATCNAKVAYAVAKFCWLNKGKYGGLVYCREHQ